MKRLVQLILHIIICLFLSVCTSGSGNFPPVAVIDGELKTYKNEPLRLDGTKSMDPDGDELRFFWEVTAAPSGSKPVLGDVHSSTPLFIGDRDGIYEITLVVSDGKEESEPEIARLMVFRDNLTPIADAGGDSSIKITDTMTLDGRASADPTNRPLKFTWSIKSKPENSNAVIENSSSSIARFKPDVPHSKYEIKLIVSNGEYEDEDTSFITVVNSPPVANAGSDGVARPGEKYYLHGSWFDADNDIIIAYNWRIISHPGDPSIVRLEDCDLDKCTIITDPYATGDYVVEFKVFDGEDWSEPDRVIISTYNNSPSVNLGPDRTVGHCYNGEYIVVNELQPNCSGAIVKLILSSTVSDPDGDPVNFLWSTLSKPQSAPEPVFLPREASTTEVYIGSPAPTILGEYVFRLTARDIYGATASDDVKIIVTNRTPDSEGCVGTCSDIKSFLFCNYDSNYQRCFKWPLVGFTNFQLRGTDPDKDPLTIRLNLSVNNNGWNCVSPQEVNCNSHEVCTANIALPAFTFSALCNNSFSWDGSTVIRISVRDAFGAEFADDRDDIQLTVDCNICN